MTNLTVLEARTREEEGFRGAPYLDTKRLWTFAYGRCLETNPLTPIEWRYLLSTKAIKVEITEEGALWLMRNNLLDAVHECSKFSFWERLNDARQNALAAMVYQMGIDKVRGTRLIRGFKDMLAALEAGDYEAAARAGLESKWAKVDTPERAERTMEQMRTGKF